MDITDLGDGVFAIDTEMSGYDGITAAYLVRSDRPCLVETGTARSAAVVADALARLGVGPADLSTIVVTHIHLDHAGGVGDLAERFPDADVVVQEAGARHLADPSRLLASARRVFGDRVVDDVLGPLRPTPARRLTAVGEVGLVDLGAGRVLRAYHSPGHARHHVGLVDSETGDLYVGDAAGLWIPDTGDVRPATPPPDFDLELACASLRRFAELGPTRLLFSHFGPVSEPATTLERAEDELRRWVDWVRSARSEQPTLDHAVAMVRQRAAQQYPRLHGDPDLERKFEELSATEANVAGIWRLLEREEPVAG